MRTHTSVGTQLLPKSRHREGSGRKAIGQEAAGMIQVRDDWVAAVEGGHAEITGKLWW